MKQVGWTVFQSCLGWLFLHFHFTFYKANFSHLQQASQPFSYLPQLCILQEWWERAHQVCGVIQHTYFVEELLKTAWWKIVSIVMTRWEWEHAAFTHTVSHSSLSHQTNYLQVLGVISGAALDKVAFFSPPCSWLWQDTMSGNQPASVHTFFPPILCGSLYLHVCVCVFILPVQPRGPNVATLHW